MSAPIRAIETRYQGYRFRSRTEARWAVFFDAAGYQWSYEEQGYQLSDGVRYLPDFYLPEPAIFAEVKGTGFKASNDDARKWVMFSQQVELPLVVLSGAPAPQNYPVVSARSYGAGCFARLDQPEFHINQADDYARCVADHDAIEAARSARFEHGEAPDIRALRADHIEAMKRDFDRALALEDMDLAEAIHSQICQAEIAAWAPWRTAGSVTTGSEDAQN